MFLCLTCPTVYGKTETILCIIFLEIFFFFSNILWTDWNVFNYGIKFLLFAKNSFVISSLSFVVELWLIKKIFKSKKLSCSALDYAIYIVAQMLWYFRDLVFFIRWSSFRFINTFLSGSIFGFKICAKSFFFKYLYLVIDWLLSILCFWYLICPQNLPFCLY